MMNRFEIIRGDDAIDREAHHLYLFKHIVRNYTSALAKRATHSPSITDNQKGGTKI